MLHTNEDSEIIKAMSHLYHTPAKVDELSMANNKRIVQYGV